MRAKNGEFVVDQAERQDKVRQLLEEQGTVSVEGISGVALGVSDMTIRRDLEELASLGEIERVHGGARSAQGRPHAMLRHGIRTAKSALSMPRKRCKSRAALWELIEESSAIFLGTGTTVEQMASILPAFRLRIMTEFAFGVFNLLEAREDCDLCLHGTVPSPHRRFCGTNGRGYPACTGYRRCVSAPTASWTVVLVRPTWTRAVSSSSP